MRDDPADGRAKLVSPTPAGRLIRDEALAALGTLFPMLDAMVEPAELTALITSLRRIRVALDRQRD